MLELQGDFRYIALFILVLIPLVVSFQRDQERRGWTLVAVGNLIMILTLMLPAIAGQQLLSDVTMLFNEGTNVSNPRVFTSGAILFGLLGGYIVLFGGLLDLREMDVSRFARLVGSVAGVGVIILLITSGSLDIYSIMVEFYARGETLVQRLIEHFVFVVVSLIAGLIVGVALGLWASRDERIEPSILYSVGIIQTIPSLALFGVLLVPLARLGDQPFTTVLGFFATSLAIGLVAVFIYWRLYDLLPESIRTPFLILCTVLLFIPAALFLVIVVTFGFQSLLQVVTSEALSSRFLLVSAGFISLPILTLIRRQISDNNTMLRRVLQWGRYGIFAVSVLGLLALLYIAGQNIVGETPLGELTIRDLGVSGIGTAPAIIALTLYSLLPLVRNTYVGLNNIDPAIIDSGRGLGMTPSQIFFQIELPLAFPVIMAGVRNAGISLVGIAAVASIIGAGALGDFILLGVNSTSVDLILLGAIPAIGLAVLVDALLQVLEAFFTSPGIRQVTK